MATGLPARSEMTPEDKAKIAKKNANLGALIAYMRTLPDNPEPQDIRRVAIIAKTTASED